LVTDQRKLGDVRLASKIVSSLSEAGEATAVPRIGVLPTVQRNPEPLKIDGGPGRGSKGMIFTVVEWSFA
jgi:hypothetical protein